MKHRKWYYLFSGIIVSVCALSIVLFGLKPSIDFTGGSRIEIGGVSDPDKVRDFMNGFGLEGVVIQKVGDDAFSARFKEIDEAKHNEIKDKLTESLGESAEELGFETVGPSISREITEKAFFAVALASIFIIFYISYSFRKVAKPASSWEFGVTAVLALLHDALIVLGVFSILGRFLNVEVDPLFITAILTIIGFSVHDTIIIFDRIREKLIHTSQEDFEEIIEKSITEVLPRTLTTSFTSWSMLFILMIFGGRTIFYFLLALVIGMFVGTYSSIFLASPLLLTWQKIKAKRSS